MNKKIVGTAVGILLSLVPVILWVVIYLFTEFIVGWVGALMGILFIYPYRKINPDDKTKFPYIVGALLIFAEIVVAELLSLGILAAMNEISLSEALALEDVALYTVIDIVIGLALSYVIFFAFIASARKKDNLQNIRQRTDVPGANTAGQSGDFYSAASNESYFTSDAQSGPFDTSAAESKPFENNDDNTI